MITDLITNWISFGYEKNPDLIIAFISDEFYITRSSSFYNSGGVKVVAESGNTLRIQSLPKPSSGY
jgi:hypothetical protein